MAQNPPEKKKRKLPEDALKGDDRHLMRCIFGDEIMAELDKIISENSEEKLKGDKESFVTRYATQSANLVASFELRI